MPGLKLMMVGDGPQREELEKLAGKLGIKKNVIFTGYVTYGPEIVKICRANDIYLTASKSENMPLSVLETMSVGLPIIAVKEKGLAEIVENGVNGFFVPTDNPEAMAEKTLELLAKPKLMEKMGRNSRTLAMKYSKENVSSLLEKFYKETMEKFKLENSESPASDETGAAGAKIQAQALKFKKLIDKILSEEDLIS